MLFPKLPARTVGRPASPCSNVVHNQHFQVHQWSENHLCWLISGIDLSISESLREKTVCKHYHCVWDGMSKAARKGADALLKEYAKELRPLVSSILAIFTACCHNKIPKMEELVVKERELPERLMATHSVVVDCYEKKLGGREIENRAALHQQNAVALRQEVDDLLDYIDKLYSICGDSTHSYRITKVSASEFGGRLK